MADDTTKQTRWNQPMLRIDKGGTKPDGRRGRQGRGNKPPIRCPYCGSSFTLPLQTHFELEPDCGKQAIQGD